MRILKASRGTIKTSHYIDTDLKSDITDILEDDLCLDIVNFGFSEHLAFEKEVFTESADFFNTLIDDEPKEIATMFCQGKDLDSYGRCANPDRDYFRLDKDGNVESTNRPGKIYYDTLLDDIVDYIMDHIDDTEFPEEVQELIDDYFNDVEA